MFSNVGFGASVVAMNAYLPTLAKEDPHVRELAETLSQPSPEPEAEEPTRRDSSEPLLGPVASPAHDPQTKYDALLSSTTARISSHGIAFGYMAGIVLLAVALVPVTMLHGSTWALRLAIGLSGIWWAVGTIPAAIWLPSVEESMTPDEEWGSSRSEGDWSFRKEVVGAWVRLGNMLRLSEVRKLRNTFKYLAAWFLLSDGGHSISLS